ncbi:Fc.00g097980.m01.CDS01 [Cosmosporella sp. VM-42]
MELSFDAAEIIRRKKLQYCRFSDANQWQLLDQIMLPEATLEFVDSSGSIISQGGLEFKASSREEWKTFCSKAFTDQQTIHLIGEGEMEQIGADEIKAIWGIMYHVGTEGTGGMHGAGGGYFYETWKRKGQDWFMETLRMERSFWKVAGV